MRRGFSLIDLLVVLAILAIVSAIVLPITASSRSSSKKTRCLEQVRQFGIATALYGADNDERLPWGPCRRTKAIIERGVDMWNDSRNDLAKQLNTVEVLLSSYGVTEAQWRCPDDFFDPNAAREGDRKPTFYEEYGSSYQFDDSRALLGWTINQYPEPAKRIIFIDAGPFHFGSKTQPQTGKSNALFADMHAKACTTQERIHFFTLDP